MKMFLTREEFRSTAGLFGTFYMSLEGHRKDKFSADLLTLSPEELYSKYPDKFTSVTEEGVYWDMPQEDYLAAMKVFAKHSGALAKIINAVRVIIQTFKFSTQEFLDDFRGLNLTENAE